MWTLHIINVCMCICAMCTWVYTGSRQHYSERKQSFSIQNDRNDTTRRCCCCRRRRRRCSLCNAALTLVLALLLLFFCLLFLRPLLIVVVAAATQFGDLPNRLCRHFSHTQRTPARTRRGIERDGDTLTFKYGSKARSLHVLAPHFLIVLVGLAFQNTNTHT